MRRALNPATDVNPPAYNYPTEQDVIFYINCNAAAQHAVTGNRSYTVAEMLERMLSDKFEAVEERDSCLQISDGSDVATILQHQSDKAMIDIGKNIDHIEDLIIK